MIALQNEILENKLVSLSKELNIQANELLETFISERLNEEERISNISYIKYISKEEDKEILDSLKLISDKDKTIDHKATIITNI
jgi:hypothetical protein